MGNIEAAYLAEQQYIALRIENLEPKSLLEIVLENGFANLDEYFLEKADYQVALLNFTHTEVYPENAASEMIKMISKGDPGLLMMNTDRTIVYHGDTDFNREYCVEHDIPVIEYLTSGGTLVASNGELSIGVCIPNFIDISDEWFLEKLAGIFRKYKDNVVVAGNDILIDDKKVCGSAYYRSTNAFCCVSQFSFDNKSELIGQICPEPKTGKIPGWIDFMTRDELREAISEWL